MKEPLTCPACSHEFTPIRKPPGRRAGTIERGSFPERVVNFLHDNPDSILTYDEAIERFSTGRLTPRNVPKAMDVALKYGYVERVVSPRGKPALRAPVVT